MRGVPNTATLIVKSTSSTFIATTIIVTTTRKNYCYHEFLFWCSCCDFEFYFYIRFCLYLPFYSHFQTNAPH